MLFVTHFINVFPAYEWNLVKIQVYSNCNSNHPSGSQIYNTFLQGLDHKLTNRSWSGFNIFHIGIHSSFKIKMKIWPSQSLGTKVIDIIIDLWGKVRFPVPDLPLSHKRRHTVVNQTFEELAFRYVFSHLLKGRILTDTKYDIVISIQIQILHDASHLSWQIPLHFLILDKQDVWVFFILPPSQIPVKPILKTTLFIHSNKLRKAALEFPQFFHRLIHVIIRHEHIFDIPHDNNKLSFPIFNCLLVKFRLKVRSQLSGDWHVVRCYCANGPTNPSF